MRTMAWRLKMESLTRRCRFARNIVLTKWGSGRKSLEHMKMRMIRMEQIGQTCMDCQHKFTTSTLRASYLLQKVAITSLTGQQHPKDNNLATRPIKKVLAASIIAEVQAKIAQHRRRKPLKQLALKRLSRSK